MKFSYIPDGIDGLVLTDMEYLKELDSRLLYELDILLNKRGDFTMSRYIDGGRNGDCLWTIDKDYTLLIEPLENTNGILDNYSYDGYEWPWTYYASNIRKVVIENGVTADRDISFMFSGMENCEDFDIASLDVSKVKTANGLFLDCHSLAGLSTLSPTSELTHRLC